jgi:hypothetical protein
MYCRLGEDTPTTGDQSESGTATRSPEHSQLHEALNAFRAEHSDGVYSAKRTIDPLLTRGRWPRRSTAVGRLIEAKLVTLVAPEVTSRELRDCRDLLEAALAPLAA